MHYVKERGHPRGTVTFCSRLPLGSLFIWPARWHLGDSEGKALFEVQCLRRRARILPVSGAELLSLCHLYPDPLPSHPTLLANHTPQRAMRSSHGTSVKAVWPQASAPPL